MSGTATIASKLGLNVTRESNAYKEVATEVLTLDMLNLHSRSSEYNDREYKSLNVRVNESLPYIDETGEVGESSTITIGKAINDIARQIGVATNEAFPVEVGDVLSAYGTGDLKIKLKVEIIVRENNDGQDIVTIPMFVGEDIKKFAGRITKERQARLEEANTYSNALGKATVAPKAVTF